MKGDNIISDELREPGEQARAWLMRLKSGDATQHDLGALARWRALSETHERAYQTELKLWRAIGTAATMQDDAQPVRPAAPLMTRRWMLRGGAGLAASAVAGVLLVGGEGAPAGATTFETRKGERKRFQLGDGLHLELNTDSRLFFWPGDEAPRLTLDRGEAMVWVAYGKDRQLLARANAVEVIARQARFVLREESGMTKIACLDGAVSVRAEGKAYTLDESRSLTIGDDAMQPVEAPAVENEVAWQKGLFTFRNRRASDVVAELNRYRPGHVFLPGDRADVPISGVIRLDRIDLAVDHIARSLNMKVVRLPGGLALLRS